MICEILIILFDVALTCGITLAIPTGHYYHYWAPFLLLIIGYVVAVGIMWSILFIFALPYKKTNHYSKPSKWALFWLSDALHYIHKHARIKVKIINEEALPKEKFLLVCNHLSKFDPMIISDLYGYKHNIAFISKPTNFKIPIGGRFMNRCCYLSIDRYDKLKSLEVIKEAIELITNDYSSIGVFPEGTRCEDGLFHEFHEGVFSIALKANCPLVVMTVKNTNSIKKNFPKRKTVVELEIVKILYPNDYSGMIAKELSDQCHSLMEESLNR